MGSVKLKDLKAFVRYDGSGRVVAGSLVFRKKKPKNGRWQEITKNLCCNPDPNPTTTTTTSGGGGTPTAWIGRITSDLATACESGSNVFYTAGPIIDGHVIYQNADLTNPYTETGLYFSTEGYLYQLGGAGIAASLGPCFVGTSVRISHDTMFDPICSTATTLSVQITSGTSLSDALTITGDFASLGAYYTPADPGNPMSQPPRFDIAYLVGGVLKNRYFTLTGVGVASGADPMFGLSPEQTCS